MRSACESSFNREPGWLPAPAPFLKWAGGKSQLLTQFRRLLPADAARRRYHEPFLGGGALFFALAPKRACLGDCNADLMATYQVVQRDLEGLLAALAPLTRGHSQARYYGVRRRWNTQRARLLPAQRAALFIYLNKTGYNGLWRVNSRGENNVPAGRYQRPGVYDPALLRADAALLARAQLCTGPFESVLERAQAGDFVYLDPPYQPLSRTASFTAYARGGFGEADQRRLADVFGQLDRRGCLVMLSNSDCVPIRTLYRHFRIDAVQAARSINSKGGGRGLISELVVRNYG
ncbi:MAG TPA: DNA adenine methylase [Polyangia bacterium]|nr:DNA adenine methylase [Polyangia bacterium]